MNTLADLVTCLPADAVGKLRSELQEDGYLILSLDGSDVVDKQSFLAAVKRDLPGEVGLQPHSWDAFPEVVRRGIARTGSELVVVLWTSADRMEQRSLQEFLTAVQIFTDLLRSRIEEVPDGRFHLVLAGDAPNFR